MDASQQKHGQSNRRKEAFALEVPRQQDDTVPARIETRIQKTASLVLADAYEAYCELREQGTEIDKSVFAARYPEIRHSLIRRIEVHEFLEDSDIGFGATSLEEIVKGDELFETFRVVEKLGRGALGHVFLCEQPDIGDRQAVVKVAFRGAYEAETLGRLSHSNIMPVFSIHEDELTQRSGICMPFHGRSTLLDVMDLAWNDTTVPRDGNLVNRAAVRWSQERDQVNGSAKPVGAAPGYVDSVLRIGLELASALEHSHERGVRHDDLKPSNILIGESGQTLLLDFNLSSREGEAGHYGGTLPYMSPEQIRRVGSTHFEVDNRSDIFSLGVLLYELMTGQRPFADPARDVDEEQTGRHLEQLRVAEVTPVTEYNSDVEPDLSDIVLRCLQFAPQDRFPDVSTLRESLEQFKLKRETKQARSRSQPRTIRWLAAALVAGVSLCLGAAAMTGEGRDRDQGRPQVATESASVKWQAVFGEARRLTYLREYNKAAAAFETLIESYPGPANAGLAWLALKSDVAGANEICRLHSELAIENGFESAAVWNNYALAFPAGTNIPLRQRALDEALAINPDAYEAYYNRAKTDHARYWALDKRHAYGAVPFQRLYLPHAAVADIMRVRERFPENGRVAFTASLILADYAKHDDSYRAELLEALRVARLSGNHPRLDLKFGNFSWLFDDPEYLEIIELEVDAGAGDVFDASMDPLAE